MGHSLASPGHWYLGLSDRPHLSSLPAATSWGLGSRKEGPEFSRPNPTLPSTFHPAGISAILLDTQSPPSPATPHLGRFLITLPFWLHQGFYQWLLSSFLGHFLGLRAEKGQGL